MNEGALAPVPTMAAGPRRVGLALSGGGFRAAAYHLGVLKRLEELGVLAQIEALSTVSGGSITGALYALRCAEHDGSPGSYPVDSLITEMETFLRDNLRSRALFGTPRRAVRALQSVLSTRISRIGLMVEHLDEMLFKGTTLDQLPFWIAINATNLRTGKGWRFMADRAGDYLAGATEKTNKIRVAEAVAASAAYPGLTDSYAFETRWEDLRGDMLSESRWERPPLGRPGEVSEWRKRFGRLQGAVRFPLVDGGLYDNEGINTLRGHKVTHAIVSAVAPPANDSASGFRPWRLMRIIEVLHDRLGGATRQLAHEMSHGVHPNEAATRLRTLASKLRGVATHDVSAATRVALEAATAECDALAAVGVPGRGVQFTATAQALLHRRDLADNAFAKTGGVDVPLKYQGIAGEIVDELARVRTDLDALEPTVLELLVAQGYFVADQTIKEFMPDLLNGRPAGEWYSGALAPDWPRAHEAVTGANRSTKATVLILQSAARRKMLMGRFAAGQPTWRYWANLTLVALPTALLLLGVAGWVVYGVVVAGAVGLRGVKDLLGAAWRFYAALV